MSAPSIAVTLPDGSIRNYPAGTTGAAVAASIGAGLAKAALAIRLDGQLKDLKTAITRDARLEIVTLKDKNEAELLELIRHDGAHVLAQAVQELFPGAQITFGPATDDGFYYDFVRDEPFTPDDFGRIEERMRQIVQRDLSIDREEWPAQKAVEHFRSVGETYKAEWVAELAGRGEPITIYRQGDQWLDLCKGPHLPSTGKLPIAFKLMKVSGAYWRGDANNRQLQRVYATAWRDPKELDAYLKRLEEVEKRDHRKIARQLNLFHQQEEAPGMVFWHPKGWAIWQAVEQYVREVYRRNGYCEVRGPQILDVSLWKKSGHWDNYKENMFFTESEKRTYAVKPMNCPGHVQIYNAGLHSYRDLPIRYAEFGACHRNEPSGALHGIMRVRAFTQDDGHIFCTPDQVEAEVSAFHRQAMQVYADFGFTDIAVKIALRPEKRLGTDEFWDFTEETLRNALRANGVAWEELPGEGVFYAPKIEYHLKDSIGRSWQVGTMQLDYMMPERLGAHYIDEKSERKMPVMLHRAIVGSMERFIGILIEHHAGLMPLWLAPVQAVLMTITDRQAPYVKQVCESLRNQGFRVETDLRNEKVGFKIREHTLQRVPYLLVAGDREVETNTLAIRSRNGKDLGAVSLELIAERLGREVSSRGRLAWEG